MVLQKIEPQEEQQHQRQAVEAAPDELVDVELADELVELFDQQLVIILVRHGHLVSFY